jgi:hemerythrin-like domain-containing protein
MALELIEARLQAGMRIDDVQSLARVLRDQLQAHAELEDELLFTGLDPRLPAQVQELRKDHIGVERAFRAAAQAKTPETAAAELRRAVEVVRRHLAKEERILYPLVHQVLPEAELRLAASKWATLRGVHIPEPALVRRTA